MVISIRFLKNFYRFTPLRGQSCAVLLVVRTRDLDTSRGKWTMPQEQAEVRVMYCYML